MPESIPRGWAISPMEQVSSLKGRLGWQGLKAAHYRTEGPYVVSSAHFDRERISWDLCPRVSRQRYEVDTNIQLREGDALLMKDGAALGKIAYVEALPGDACLNSHLLLVRPIREAYVPKFLFYTLRSNAFQRYIQKHANGLTFLGISQKAIGQYPFRLPPLPEQQQIAAVLDTIDEAIRKTEQIIAKLKQVKQGLLHDLLTRGIDHNGELRDPLRHPEQFKDSPLGRIPKEWRISTLGSEFTLQRGFDITLEEQRPGNVPVVSSSGITSFHDTPMVGGPGVVTGRKGKLGDTYYINQPFWPHDTSLWVKDFHGNDRRFAALFIKALRLERFDAATSVPTLNRNFVHPLPVALPAVREQHRIVVTLDAAGKRIADEEQQRHKWDRLKSGLMEDLLTGRVRVTPLLEAGAR